MEYVRALKFPLAGEGWVAKVLLGTVIGLVPIAGLATYGYGIEVIRRVASDDREELPAWDRFGRYLARGFAMTVAALLYMLPGVIFALLALVAGRQSGAVSAAGFLLALLYLLLVGVMFPAAIARYALTDEWFSMFDLGWIFGFVGRNLGTYIVMLIVSVIFASLLMLAGFVAFFVGSYVATFWVILMANHLLGQLLRQSGAV